MAFLEHVLVVCIHNTGHHGIRKLKLSSLQKLRILESPPEHWCTRIVHNEVHNVVTSSIHACDGRMHRPTAVPAQYSY